MTDQTVLASLMQDRLKK